MKILDPSFVRLCEESGIIIDEDQNVSFDDDTINNLISFYQGVVWHERKEFGLMLTRIIDRERQRY